MLGKEEQVTNTETGRLLVAVSRSLCATEQFSFGSPGK